MRILHCIPSVEPLSGGPGNAAIKLIEELCRRGVEVTLLTDPEQEVGQLENIEIVPFQPWVRRFSWDPCLGARARKWLHDFDLVHIHSLFNGMSITMCRMARVMGVPYILKPLGTLSPRCLAKSRLKKEISLALWERENIEGAVAVHFTSEAERARATTSGRGLGKERAGKEASSEQKTASRGVPRPGIGFKIQRGFVVPEGLDWEELGQLPKRGLMRERLGIGESESLFLFLGRLERIKGLEVFLPAFVRWAKERHRNARCVVAGPGGGKYRAMLERLVVNHGGQDYVRFVGPVYGDERLSALTDADVVVLPSFHESFGMAAAEGMACGKPLLLSDQVAIAPAVQASDAGLLSDVEHCAWIDALERLWVRKAEWGEMGQRGRAWAKEECDWVKIAAIVVGEYGRGIERAESREQKPGSRG